MTTVIAYGTPAEGQDEAMGRYLKGALPLILQAGGRPIKRLAVTETFAEGPAPTQMLVLDFDDRAAAASVFESEAYKALVPDRNLAFAQFSLLLAQDM